MVFVVHYLSCEQRSEGALEHIIDNVYHNLDVILDFLLKKHEEETAIKLRDICSHYAKMIPKENSPKLMELRDKDTLQKTRPSLKAHPFRRSLPVDHVRLGSLPSSSIDGPTRHSTSLGSLRVKNGGDEEEDPRNKNERDTERADVILDLQQKINKAEKQANVMKQENSRLQQENMKLRTQMLTVVSSSLPTPNALPSLLEELKSQIMEDFKKIVLETITPSTLNTLVETAKANVMKNMEDTLQKQVKLIVVQEVHKLKEVPPKDSDLESPELKEDPETKEPN